LCWSGNGTVEFDEPELPHCLFAEPDVAAPIPAAEFLDRRRRLLNDRRHIGGDRRLHAAKESRSRERCHSHADHD
jgi:hypothetical protein